MRELWRRYWATVIVMGTVAVIGLWPQLLTPLGHMYVKMCSRLFAGAPIGHHYPPLLVAFLAPILATLLIAGAILGVRQVVGQRRLAAALVARRLRPDEAAIRVSPGLANARDVVVTGDCEIYAFCSGLMRPRVYLSRGVLSILDDAEIDALLRHERHHARRRDPLRLFVLDMARRLIPVLPALETFEQWVRVRIELAADRAALGSQPPEVLASTMVKIMRGQPAGASITGAAGISPTQARIAALRGNPVRVEVDRGALLLSGLMLIELMVVTVWLAFQALPNPSACSMCPAF